LWKFSIQNAASDYQCFIPSGEKNDTEDPFKVNILHSYHGNDYNDYMLAFRAPVIGNDGWRQRIGEALNLPDVTQLNPHEVDIVIQHPHVFHKNWDNGICLARPQHVFIHYYDGQGDNMSVDSSLQTQFKILSAKGPEEQPFSTSNEGIANYHFGGESRMWRLISGQNHQLKFKFDDVKENTKFVISNIKYISGPIENTVKTTINVMLSSAGWDRLDELIAPPKAGRVENADVQSYMSIGEMFKVLHREEHVSEAQMRLLGIPVG
jgi:hypothetical protein